VSEGNAVRYLGVDLAWRDHAADRPANESGVAAIDGRGVVLDAGWTRGVSNSLAWADHISAQHDALMFVDAALVVSNDSGQRLCETQVGQRYGRWKVSANSTNRKSPRLAGVAFLRQAQTQSGWRYSDGRRGPSHRNGRVISETYPYTVLVGAHELGYATERPRYKRKPPHTRATEWRSMRAATCDELIERLNQLADADPPLQLNSHPFTRVLVQESSPTADAAYKHREDMIDALLCAWAASLWDRHGLSRCQVLGLPADEPAATIIAPARVEQRA
jgi:predicted RNase H-like nuclease